MIIAEHDDTDAERLCREGVRRELDIHWFKLGLDSTQYSVLWKSEELPTLRFQNVELSEDTMADASWVFHREMQLKAKPYVHASVGTQHENEFCMREWFSLLASAILAFKFSVYSYKWISSYYRADFTDRKLFMLSQARNLGIDVPAFAASTTFHAPLGTPVVVKAINADEVIDERYFPTTLLEDNQVKDYMGQRSECPSLVQRKISAVCELRLFYVNGIWLCLSLTDQTAPVDIRYSTRARVELVDALPNDFKAKLEELCKTLEMSYCVFDILIDRSRRHWLVDVTPNGTWSWYEDISSIGVTQRILDALEVGNGDRAPRGVC